MRDVLQFWLLRGLAGREDTIETEACGGSMRYYLLFLFGFHLASSSRGGSMRYYSVSPSNCSLIWGVIANHVFCQLACRRQPAKSYTKTMFLKTIFFLLPALAAPNRGEQA